MQSGKHTCQFGCSSYWQWWGSGEAVWRWSHFILDLKTVHDVSCLFAEGRGRGELDAFRRWRVRNWWCWEEALEGRGEAYLSSPSCIEQECCLLFPALNKVQSLHEFCHCSFPLRQQADASSPHQHCLLVIKDMGTLPKKDNSLTGKEQNLVGQN